MLKGHDITDTCELCAQRAAAGYFDQPKRERLQKGTFSDQKGVENPRPPNDSVALVKFSTKPLEAIRHPHVDSRPAVVLSARAFSFVLSNCLFSYIPAPNGGCRSSATWQVALQGILHHSIAGLVTPSTGW